MDDKEVKDMAMTILKTQIVKAFNESPEALEKLVKSALEKPVEDPQKRYGATMPYLDYLVGEEIRNVAKQAVHNIVQQSKEVIEAQVRQALVSEDVINAFTKNIINTTENSWKINVKFEAVKNDY